MKLVNSKKTIDKILEQHEEEFYVEDSQEIYPCWEVKVDRDAGFLYFQIDLKKVYKHPIKSIGPDGLSLENLNEYLRIFKTKDMEALKKALNG
jgi:RNA binding exosome subunit